MIMLSGGEIRNSESKNNSVGRPYIEMSKSDTVDARGRRLQLVGYIKVIAMLLGLLF